ncbi:MAG: hypothetical protein L6R42_006168 [Xanthoria sp. 1 TBL-2021]|nr:MAG: hypothetical protein L6R42_006168 [Xanthoria sp. 1 TBL-2021]
MQWIEDVLTPVDFPTFRGREPINSPRGFANSRLTDAPNLLTYNLADKTVRSGNVACLAVGGKYDVSCYYLHSALLVNMTLKGKISTGSTMIKWGMVLDTLKIGQGADVLSDWFRVQREARIGAAQNAVNRLVRRFVDEYNAKLKKKFNHTEEEFMKLRKKDPVTIEKKGRLPGIRKKILQKLHERFPGSLPSVLVEYRKNVIGQAYEGQTLLLKSKCAVCQNIYPFLVPTNVRGRNPQPAQDYDDPAELSPKRLEVPRGCCAECLVFIPTMGALNLVSRLVEQLA